MRPCKTCKNEGCAAHGKDFFTYYGDGITCYGYIPMTNADRIRAMTDEELAKLCQNSCCRAEYDDCPTQFYDDCVECWLDWLKQEEDNA